MRWVKGLLHDFIEQKERVTELERNIEKLNFALNTHSQIVHTKKNSVVNTSQMQSKMLSPIIPQGSEML